MRPLPLTPTAALTRASLERVYPCRDDETQVGIFERTIDDASAAVNAWGEEVKQVAFQAAKAGKNPINAALAKIAWLPDYLIA